MGWLVLFLFGGLLWATVPLLFLLKQRRQSRRWIQVEGTIVGAKRARPPGAETKDKSVFRITYLFRDATGTERTGQDYRSKKPAKNQTVDVWYDPDSPGISEIMWSTTQRRLLIVGMLVFSAAGWACVVWVIAALAGVVDPGPLLEPAETPMPAL